MVELLYTTYNSEELAHHTIIGAKVCKSCIKTYMLISFHCFFFKLYIDAQAVEAHFFQQVYQSAEEIT